MDTLSYSAFRGHLAHVLDQVNMDHKPMLITRKNGKSAVVMSLDDFQSYEETFYLMSSPKNAERLNQAMSEVNTAKTKEHPLIEE